MARPSPLALWHLLSLDAPTIATLWTVFLARSVHLTLPWTAPAAMFLAVWMVYVADRLLDSRSLMPGNWQTGTLVTGNALGLETRHRFHHRHRGGFLTGIAAAAIALATLLHRLDPRALQLYALLAALLAAWMLLIHARALSANSPRLPKELAVGLFFSAAVFIPTVSRAPLLRATLLPNAALFAAVCTLNCLFVYAWEHPGARTFAHWTTRWSTRHLPQLAIATCVLAMLVASLAAKRILASPATPAIACALSAALLLLLHTLRRRFTRIHLRACADLALLTPLLFLFPKTPSS
jgi:hypothetical protein